MINHFRTLLLNTTVAKSSGPGSEIVPSDFVPLPMTSAIATVRQALFGVNPDSATLNARAHQYLSVVSATELRNFPAELDSRITYDLKTKTTFYGAPEIEVRKVDGTTHDLALVISEPPAPQDGRTELVWTVEIDAGDMLIRSRDGTLLSQQAYALNTQYSLPGTALKFIFTEAQDSDKWRIHQHLMPTADLADVLAKLSSLGPAMEALLEPRTAEPFKTFYNAWNNHPIGVYRLAAAICAYVYRLNEILEQHDA